jgi:hypothetical protein
VRWNYPKKSRIPLRSNGGGTDAGIMGGREWISMVSNLNLTWKSACLEILHYVGCSDVAICVCAHTASGSSRNELLDRSLKNVRHLWSGASGRVRWTILIGNGPRGRQPRLKTTFSTGNLFSPAFPAEKTHLLIVWANDTACASSLAETASSSCRTISPDRPLSPRYCISGS